MSDRAEMAQSYWALSNQVTGFAVVEMIGIVLAAAAEPSIKAGIESNGGLTIGLICVGTLLYILGLVHCYYKEVKCSQDHDIFKSTHYARIGLIILTNLLGILWVWYLASTPLEKNNLCMPPL